MEVPMARGTWRWRLGIGMPFNINTLHRMINSITITSELFVTVAIERCRCDHSVNVKDIPSSVHYYLSSTPTFPSRETSPQHQVQSMSMEFPGITIARNDHLTRVISVCVFYARYMTAIITSHRHHAQQERLVHCSQRKLTSSSK